jgi:hypothetical protein
MKKHRLRSVKYINYCAAYTLLTTRKYVDIWPRKVSAAGGMISVVPNGRNRFLPKQLRYSGSPWPQSEDGNSRDTHCWSSNLRHNSTHARTCSCCLSVRDHIWLSFCLSRFSLHCCNCFGSHCYTFGYPADVITRDLS